MLYMVQIQKSQLSEKLLSGSRVNLVKNSFFYGKLFCYLKSTRDKILLAILLL